MVRCLFNRVQAATGAPSSGAPSSETAAPKQAEASPAPTPAAPSSQQVCCVHVLDCTVVLQVQVLFRVCFLGSLVTFRVFGVCVSLVSLGSFSMGFVRVSFRVS